MLEKRKASALTTYRSTFMKTITAYEDHYDTMTSLLKHILYICNTCHSVDTVLNQSKPESIFLLFDDVPDLMLSRLFAEGEAAAIQIRQIQ